MITLILSVMLLARTPDMFEQAARRAACEQEAYDWAMQQVSDLPPEAALFWRLCAAPGNAAEPRCDQIGRWFDNLVRTKIEVCASEMEV